MTRSDLGMNTSEFWICKKRALSVDNGWLPNWRSTNLSPPPEIAFSLDPSVGVKRVFLHKSYWWQEKNDCHNIQPLHPIGSQSWHGWIDVCLSSSLSYCDETAWAVVYHIKSKHQQYLVSAIQDKQIMIPINMKPIFDIIDHFTHILNDNYQTYKHYSNKLSEMSILAEWRI